MDLICCDKLKFRQKFHKKLHPRWKEPIENFWKKKSHDPVDWSNVIFQCQVRQLLTAVNVQHITALWPAAVHSCEDGREKSENRSRCHSNIFLCSPRNANKLSSCSSTDANLAPMLVTSLLLWRVASCSFISSYSPLALASEIPSTNLDGCERFAFEPSAMDVLDVTTKSRRAICIVRFGEKVQRGTSCNEVYYTSLCLKESSALIHLAQFMACAVLNQWKETLRGEKMKLHQNRNILRMCVCVCVLPCC